MSYFRAQQAGKIGPRTIHSFPDSTSLLSQNAGQVNPAKCALSECLKLRVQSNAPAFLFVSFVIEQSGR